MTIETESHSPPIKEVINKLGLVERVEYVGSGYTNIYTLDENADAITDMLDERGITWRLI